MIINTQMKWVFGEEPTHPISLLYIGSLSFCHPVLNLADGDYWQANG